MNRLLGLTIVFAVGLSPGLAQAATTWRVANASGAAEGCNENRDTSVCVLIRCDTPRHLETYFQVVEGDPFSDRLRMSVDGRDFAVVVDPPVVHRWGTAWKVRRTPDGFVGSLRRGRRLTLKGADITGGFDVFGLAGAKSAIDKVQASCGLKPEP